MMKNLARVGGTHSKNLYKQTSLFPPNIIVYNDKRKYGLYRHRTLLVGTRLRTKLYLHVRLARQTSVRLTLHFQYNFNTIFKR